MGGRKSPPNIKQGPGCPQESLSPILQHFRIHHWNYLQTWPQTELGHPTSWAIFFSSLSTFSMFGEGVSGTSGVSLMSLYYDYNHHSEDQEGSADTTLSLEQDQPEKRSILTNTTEFVV